MFLTDVLSKIVFGMDADDAWLILIIMGVGFVIVLIVALVSINSDKNKDSDKPFMSGYGTIKEKTCSDIGIDLYIVEFENGNRLRMRIFDNKSLILTLGDYGVVGYRGNTIYSFQRKTKDESSGIQSDAVSTCQNTIDAQRQKVDWVCPKCQHINSRLLTKCIVCGESIVNNSFEAVSVSTVQAGTNEWKCIRCGRDNKNYVGTCGCGQSKPN